MDNTPKDLNDFSLKQKIFLYFYRTKQYLYSHWLSIKYRLLEFADSFLFYILIFSISLFIGQNILLYFDVVISEEQLFNLGLTIAGIIGASIAIIFSFSTFILQSTADLFSTQYLNKFIKDKKEIYIFWTLVMLTMISFIIPHIVQIAVVEILITITFFAFLLIYSLYKELRKRINPETTLNKIRSDAIHHLEKVYKELKRGAYVQNKIFEYGEDQKNLSLATQYKSNPNWTSLASENVKYLYEIGLRLLSKNEINSFNLTLNYIHDIYLKHLDLRNGHIMRIPAGLWGTYTFEDEGFTAKILEYLESLSNRIIQDKRKENIYHLINVYESLIVQLRQYKYADKNPAARNENPILNLVLGYYLGLIYMLVQTKERDWVWESIKSISKISDALLIDRYDHFNYTQINQALDKISVSCLTDHKQEAFLKEIVDISFKHIKVGWDKYPNHPIFWKDLFKTLKKNTLALSLSPGINLSLSELYINFHAWQTGIVNAIFELEDKEKQLELKDAYVSFLEKWSDFLLDLARDIGLEDKQIGLPIIQSVDNNLRIIYGIEKKFEIKLESLYQTQFNIFSWYFQKTEKVEGSFLFNLEQAQKTLLREINDNLKEKVDSKNIIDLYMRLVQQHFEKISTGGEYNHPRVIEKLVHLGLILNKHNFDVSSVVDLIEELNERYLEVNKKYFDFKQKEPNLMGPDKYQLCKEIHDLENDIFSYNGGMVMDIKLLLKTEITKEDWDDFIGKIKYCADIEYTTVHSF